MLVGISLVSFLLQNHLELCYKAYILTFIEVGKVCITYIEKEKDLEIMSSAKTMGLGKILKKISNVGKAVIDKNSLLPKSFIYYQQEIGYIRLQEYKFQNGKIMTKIIRYKDMNDKIGEKEENEYEWTEEFEPYSAFLSLLKNSSSGGTIKVFYENKVHIINHRFLAEDEVRLRTVSFKANLVEIEAEVETQAPLKPHGKWYLWVDSGNLLPLKLRVNSTIGSASIILEKVKGDPALLTNVMKNNQ